MLIEMAKRTEYPTMVGNSSGTCTELHSSYIEKGEVKKWLLEE